MGPLERILNLEIKIYSKSCRMSELRYAASTYTSAYISEPKALRAKAERWLVGCRFLMKSPGYLFCFNCLDGQIGTLLGDRFTNRGSSEAPNDLRYCEIETLCNDL